MSPSTYLLSQVEKNCKFGSPNNKEIVAIDVVWLQIWKRIVENDMDEVMAIDIDNWSSQCRES